MKSKLFAWLGFTDVKAASGDPTVGPGPIAQAVMELKPDHVLLLSNLERDTEVLYRKWLESRTNATVSVLHHHLSGPTDFVDIHAAVVSSVEQNRTRGDRLMFHLSPGTPAMATVWIILANTRYPARLIESSREAGVREVHFPFEVAAEFIPEFLRRRSSQLEERVEGRPPEVAEFKDIIYRSAPMRQLIQRAQRVALHSVPVLLEGESGTGKELLARAIHDASQRKGHFVPVNCGAIPSELVESELFGHKKGAFTGATGDRNGYFREADTGTLFLDEVGELPLQTQVKLLRVVQEGQVTPVGATIPLKVDSRIIAATNRSLTNEVAAGRFREDLFYRLAVAVLRLPPLRERQGDIGLLIEHFLEGLHGNEQKKLSAAAKNILLSHSWPGNIRELINTLQRAFIWSEGEVIRKEDMEAALFPIPSSGSESILNMPLGDSFNLQETLGIVARHYLGRALQESAGNKTHAAELVGLSNYQTLSNWMRKYGVEN